VFRELADRPVGVIDHVLAAAQGVATALTVYRTQLGATHATVADILTSAFLFGPIGGIVSLYLFAAIYGRLGVRAGGKSARNQVIHVLAYGGIPVVASLILLALTAVFVGDAAIVDRPGAELDDFVGFILRAQFAAYVLLLLWSVVLQVMGLSEILGLATRRTFAVWMLGQLVALLAAVVLSVLIAILFPGLVPAPPH
jgi:hypothetical protein